MKQNGLQVVITADGSPTLFDPLRKEHYHSLNGAIQESRHVFIQNGLYARPVLRQQVRIFEMGLGTGLNVLLTMTEQIKQKIRIDYQAIDTYPLPLSLIGDLDYSLILGCPAEWLFMIHDAPWGEKVVLLEDFTLIKHNRSMNEMKLFPGRFDLVYYDAFSPEIQPALWQPQIFSKLYRALVPGGVLVTYSAKGAVRRAMMQAGFLVERLPGPPGKREMIRGWKRDDIR
jgi:tRNA U34 5-methylaminomethyl-2-thiouridine-forming methyltransferase MnmC